jgi:hypothetical protein
MAALGGALPAGPLPPPRQYVGKLARLSGMLHLVITIIAAASEAAATGHATHAPARGLSGTGHRI